MENKNSNAIKFNYIDSRFTPDDTTKGLFMFLIIQTVVTLAYQVLYMMGFVQSFWSYVFTLIIDAGFVTSVIMIAKSKRIDPFANLKVKKKPNFKQILIAMGISIICLFGFSALTNLFMEILYRAGYSSVVSDIVIPDFGTYIFYVFMICVVPAICEEVLFRGLICNGLKKLGTTTAVFLSAFLFMIMHGSPDQTVHQFILGIILALAFLISNNLWVPIIVHFLNNFIAVTISYVAYGDSAEEVVTETAQMYLSDYLFYAITSAVVAGVILYFLFKALSNCSKVEEKVEPVEQKNIVFPVQDYKMNYTGNYSEFSNESTMKNVEEVNNNVVEPIQVGTIEEEKKFTGTGKALLILSIVWLAFDWLSALVAGFSAIY